MLRVKFREIVILAVSLTVLINFVYFRYIYNGYVNKRGSITRKIRTYDNKIAESMNKFYGNLNLLKKIVTIKKDILYSKENLELLKSAHTTTFNMSNILKTLLVKSGVSVYEVSLSGMKRAGGKYTYSFDVKADDTLEKILRFMDLIENYSDNMYIPTYGIKPKDGVYSAQLTVNFDYVSIKQ